MSQLADGGPGRRAWNREAEALVSAGLRDDERVDADDFATDVHQRAARVPGIDGRVGLNVDERRIRIDLARHRRDQAVGHAVAQADRAAERKDHFPLTEIGVRRQRQRRQLHIIHFEQRQVQLGGDANDARGEERCPSGQGRRDRSIGVADGHDDLDAPRAVDDVGVRQDVALRIDHESRPGRPLPANDHVGVARRPFGPRAITADEDLHHAWPDFLRQRIHRFVQSDERIRRRRRLGDRLLS